MHRYVDLLEGVTEAALASFDQAEREAQERLKTGARTLDVKILQRVNLLRAITAIGIFSLAEAMLQEPDGSKEGFQVAVECLDASGNLELKQRFIDFKDAINVLKHGLGPSYDRLVKRGNSLPFRIKQPDEKFFHEGNVAEVTTLVQADNGFVRGAAAVIHEALVCAERCKKR